jgi:isopentenyldiphosphate isomerase/intracellular septation protein A
MNKKELLKKFSIGFIPLLIFIIADELFGTRIGLLAAITVGMFELTFYYLKYRLIEKFVLFDVGLIIALGSVSILLENDLFFKLKPALVETILLILLGIHAFSDKPLLFMLGKRYMKDIAIDETQMDIMRNLVKLLFFIVLFHILLIIYAAYNLSSEAWAFVSGGLFYIIFVVIFIGQFIYIKFFKTKQIRYKAQDGEEWFNLVDTQGKIIGEAPRSAVHGNSNLLHPVVHLHIFNKNGQLYLQKRSQNKDVQPGKWDTAVGGHIVAGENVLDALKREAWEELGIKNDNFQPLYKYVMKNDFESEFVYTFRINANGPFKVNRDEIDFGKFWGMKEIERNLGRKIFTPNFEQEFIMLKKILDQKKKIRSR